MPLPLKARHPNLHDGALAAHEASQQACTVARELASTALGDTANPVNLLAQVTAEKRRAGELPGQSGLDVILDSETRTRFKKDYAAYERIFAGGGITMPTPEELSGGGIDWARLAELKETHPNHNLVVAPLTLPLEQLRQIVSGVTKDSTIPGNPLKKHETTATDSDGLWVSELVSANWNSIMAATIKEWQLPTATLAPAGAPEAPPLQWTAFLLPSNSRPERTKISLDHIRQEGASATSIVGYIAYQMNRIRQGLSPVDDSTYTWAAGGFAGVKGAAQAPFVYWLSDLGRVRVSQLGVGDSDGDLGVRSPVG